jgi:hypothetical protein
MCLVRMRLGFGPRVVREQDFMLENASAVGWENPLASLEEKLVSAEWKGGRLLVVIADCWVRYATVPYVAELSGAEECEAYARGLLANAYGDAISDWVISLSSVPPGAVRVACATPPTLLAKLREVCARTGTKLISVQPQLIAAYNSWRHRIPDGSAWFVTVDGESLAAARLAPDGFDRVHTVRIGSDWTRELKRLQTFGRLASTSEQGGRVYVDAPSTFRVADLAQGEELEWLEEESPPLTTLHRLEKLRRLSA